MWDLFVGQTEDYRRRYRDIESAGLSEAWAHEKPKRVATSASEYCTVDGSMDEIWSEWQDLNLRPLPPEDSALPG